MAGILREQAIGKIVKFGVGGSPREFIVVQHGKPQAAYDGSFNNATVLLMKDIYENRQWHSSLLNDYAGSTIHSWLQNEFYALIDASIRPAILSVKIPYRPGSGTSKNISYDLPSKVFLLSMAEIGITVAQTGTALGDGAKLAFFLSGDTAQARSLRLARLNGTDDIWWLRSPEISSAAGAWYINSTGLLSSNNCNASRGIRPALVLPDYLTVLDDGTIITKDPEIAYFVWERRIDAQPWQQIAITDDMWHTDNVPTIGTTYQARVKAVSDNGMESAYTAGPIYNIDYNNDPTVTLLSAEPGEPHGAFDVAFSVDDADAADTLTVSVFHDGLEIRRIPAAERNTPYTASISLERFLQCEDGAHTLLITVADDKGGTAERPVTWYRDVRGVDVIIGPTEPEEVMPTQLTLTAHVSLTVDAEERYFACNNAYDANPTWEDITAAIINKRVYLFANETKTAETWGVAARITLTKGEIPGTVSYRDAGGSYK